MPIKKFLLVFFACNLLIACNLTKYVPQDETLLNRVKIKKDTPDLDAGALNNYVVQQPNSYALGFMRTKLALYSISGRDTTKWINRTLRKLGEEPIIFDLPLTETSRSAINQAVKNKGFLNSNVTFDIKTHKRKTDVTYKIISGTPYLIGRYEIDINDDTIKNILTRFSRRNSLENRMFDVDLLNENRNRAAQTLRRLGYYNVQKEIFAYTADTTLVKNYVDLTLLLQPQYAVDSVAKKLFTKKQIDKVTIYCLSDNRILDADYLTNSDTVYYKGYQVIYNQKKHIFTPKFLTSKIMLAPNQTYNERLVERTNSSLSGLPAIKSANVAFNEKDSNLLESKVFVSPANRYSYSVGIDGTTTTIGNVGARLNLGFADKNIFRGGEVLRLGTNATYEARWDPVEVIDANDTTKTKKKIKWGHSYIVGGEASLTIPQILLPLKESARRIYGGTTVFSINYSYQNLIKRYERQIANASITYNWQQRNSKYIFNLIDFVYVKMGSIDDDFRKKFLGPTSSIRYSFEDHLITKMGFGYSTTSRRNETSAQSFYTFRTSVKAAGNLFFIISKLTKQQKEGDVYKVFRTPYSQFVKGDFDYSYNYFINKKIRFVFHAGFGIAFPYGNSSIMPFEERFYSGGANSLRGWSPRSLGPGSYKSPPSPKGTTAIYFMNQSGDIKLDLNVELRFKLFWVLEGAAFIDAGNIWTIKNYPEQAGGAFLFTKKNVAKYNAENEKYADDNGLDKKNINSVAPFYEQIACSYGLGIRANFSFFVLRFDFGIKLHDPQNPDYRWRGWSSSLDNNDWAFNFAVGYPF